MRAIAFLVILVSLLVGSSLISATSAVPLLDDLKAQQTTTVLANALVAAVVSISDATPPGSNPSDVEANSDAVSILVPECQSTYKLIDASGNPLDTGNTPSGRFEADGLSDLVNGAPIVQEVVGGHLRTLVPLTSDMHPNCMSCHTNYNSLPSGTVVGAAAFKVKL